MFCHFIFLHTLIDRQKATYNVNWIHMKDNRNTDFVSLKHRCRMSLCHIMFGTSCLFC